MRIAESARIEGRGSPPAATQPAQLVRMTRMMNVYNPTELLAPLPGEQEQPPFRWVPAVLRFLRRRRLGILASGAVGPVLVIPSGSSRSPPTRNPTTPWSRARSRCCAPKAWPARSWRSTT